VRLTVSGSGVQIKRISIPSLPKNELKEAVRWEIKNYLPFPVETAQIDFHILNEYVEDNIKKLDLIVVACPKHLVDRTLSIAERAGSNRFILMWPFCPLEHFVGLGSD